MMSFKEFSHAVKADARLTDLIDRYSDRTDSLTDDELTEMVDRSAAIFDEADELDPYADWDEEDIFDPSEESYVDLFGPQWE